MLYTGKGDNGTTGLYGCTGRIAKTDARIEALGSLDELNSWIGLCRASTSSHESFIRDALRSFQEDLFTIQAVVAGAGKSLAVHRVAHLESIIARVEAEIDHIRSFTVTGATTLSATLDVARTLARRTERAVIADGITQGEILPYLNRLSSALFALARLAAHRAGVKEQAPSYSS